MIETADTSGAPVTSPGADATIVFALHFLGGSADAWEVLKRRTDGRLRWVAIDLPGFGDAAHESGYSVSDMADAVVGTIRRSHPTRWALAGHSMGAKVAVAVARRAEDGEPGLDGLAALVLLAGSPPSPEPMTDDKRTTMLGWFTGDEPGRRAQADGYISANVGAALPPLVHERTVADVLRARHDAWIAWLEKGSREDWAERIGLLATPALIVAGGRDEALGVDAQTRLMAPHFTNARLVTLPDSGHLLPLEAPDDLAHLIERHVAGMTVEPAIDPAYAALIQSDRVSARTRAVLTKRAAPLPVETAPLDEKAYATLAALVDRLVPQPAAARLDLAARIVQSLREREGDGWRFADLPADAEAARAGLATLDELAEAEGGPRFAALDGASQDALLHRMARGAAGPEGDAQAGRLSAAQMRLWFEEISAAAARAYVSHPATLARMGYAGIANGGDGPRKQGFVRLGAGEREEWEPLAKAARPR
jgi:pimeloyl-ACP methyl ester carboxylesterase